MMTNTIERALAKAAAAGEQAYANDEMRAPALSATIREMLMDEAEMPTFAREYNMRIMRAFTDGFDAAAEYAASGILLEVPC